jgi:hypothetical protein
MRAIQQLNKVITLSLSKGEPAARRILASLG